MNLSFWEHKEWFKAIDFAIIGSGIVGINCALTLRKNHPKAKIVIFEKGLLPEGASTKNAGFACFGSVSEIYADISRMTENDVLSLIEKRYKGILQLQKTFGKTIDYVNYGGYELFFNDDENYLTYLEKIEPINQLLKPIFKQNVFKTIDNKFAFINIKEKLIFNSFESQIDTGKMMQAYLKMAHQNDIKILNNCTMSDFKDNNHFVELSINQKLIKVKQLFLATNGFASTIFPNDMAPARAQVLITKPIKNLHIKGTFHIDEGYYYFRNYKNRLLFGGARNMAFDDERTTTMQTTSIIQYKLEEILKTVILPNTSFEIDQRWTGIMGVGQTKKPIVKKLSQNVFCGVKLGGMGVAIGAQVGQELGNLIENKKFLS